MAQDLVLKQGLKHLGRMAAETIALQVEAWVRAGILDEGEAETLVAQMRDAHGLPLAYPVRLLPNAGPFAMPGALKRRHARAVKRREKNVIEFNLNSRHAPKKSRCKQSKQ